MLLHFTLSPKVNKDVIIIAVIIIIIIIIIIITIIIILLWKNIRGSQKSFNHRNYAFQKFHGAFSREKKEGTFALSDVMSMNQTPLNFLED